MRMVATLFFALGSMPSLAADCPLSKSDSLVLLRAKNGDRAMSFCIHRGAPPNLIETRDADGKLLLSSQYEGMKALLTLNLASGVRVSFNYQNVIGDPADVQVGQTVTYREEITGANAPPAQVEITGLSAGQRSVGACTFQTVRLRRVNRNPDGSGLELDIHYAPELGWPVESSGRSLNGTPMPQTVVYAIASPEEAARECNR